MNWEEKFAAIKALDSDASLRMREPCDWYVSTRTELKKGCVLVGCGGGTGRTSPEEAVNHCWAHMTLHPPDQYLVIGAHPCRRSVRWNGFMWADIAEAA